MASVLVTPIRNKPHFAINTELERFPASEPVSPFKVNPQSGCHGDESPLLNSRNAAVLMYSSVPVSRNPSENGRRVKLKHFRLTRKFKVLPVTVSEPK